MEKASIQPTAKKRLLFLLKFIVSVAAITIVLKHVSVQEIGRLLSGIQMAPLVIAVVIFLAAQVISAQRFVYVAKTIGRRITLRESVRVHFIGLLFNQVLPSSLGGDVVKVMMFRLRLGLVRAVRSTLLDRVFGLIILMLSILIFLPLYHGMFDKLSLTFWLAIMAGGFFLMLFGAIFLAGKRVFRRIVPRSFGMIPLLLRDVRRFRFLRPLFEQFWTSLVVHVNGIVAYALIGESLGIALNWWFYVLLVPLVFLVALLPFSLSGWGLREIGAVEFFGLVGIPAEQAFTVSVLFGLLLIIVSLPGAVMLFYSGFFHPNKIVERNTSRGC